MGCWFGCVKFIQDGQPAVDLSLKELSKRTVTLLALCNAGRASDIQALDIRFIRSTGDSIVFTIPGLTKIHRSGPPKEVTFSAGGIVMSTEDSANVHAKDCTDPN